LNKNWLRERILKADDRDLIAFLTTVESDRQIDIEKAKETRRAAEIEKSSGVQGCGTAFEWMRMEKGDSLGFEHTYLYYLTCESIAHVVIYSR